MNRISLITVVHNRKATIGDAIASVSGQVDCDFEYLVIDGMSNDGTDAVIASNSARIHKSIREPDAGIYDALNKGIKSSSGDIVGFLHADDLLASPLSLKGVSDTFESGDFDAVYADLVYVDADDTGRVVRYWQSKPYDVRNFQFGWMPPHPTLYVRRKVYEEFGMYRTDHGSAADYECMIRLMVRHKVRVGYLPEVTVKMRVGGKSNATVANRLLANRADRIAWNINGMKPPALLRFTKPLRKIPQYFQRYKCDG